MRATRPAMNTRVKICGLTRAEDVATAIAASADFLGFIVECPSMRRLSVAEAAALAAPARSRAARVAVTVNPTDDLLIRIMAEMAPDYIQLHGDETLQRVAEIGATHNVKIIKAAAVATSDDIKRASEYSGAADLLLFDAKPPTGSDIRGGHGAVIDWSLIAEAPLPKVWALAGGLGPDNIARAIRQTHAPIIDVSSGVEASAGVKDSLKIRAFIHAARNPA